MPVGPFQVLTYLVSCPRTRRSVIIDPAGDEDKLLTLIQTEGLRVKYILNTHGHADHVLGNPKLKDVLKIPVCMHEIENRFFSHPEVREKSSRELGLPPPGPADITLKDGDILEAGRLKIRVIHTPGHTPGSVCYYVDGNLFSGDTLFVGAAGRTDLIGGSLDTLIERGYIPQELGKRDYSIDSGLVARSKAYGTLQNPMRAPSWIRRKRCPFVFAGLGRD